MSDHRQQIRQDLAVSVLAAVAVLPGLMPGAEFAVDGPSHLLEVHALVTQILPEDRWYTGWTDLAEVGFAVGQLNAPLPWVALAGLVAAGAPLAASYRLALLVANVVFALGALRLGRRLLGRGSAPLVFAVLASAHPADLYGIGGAAGGMWPFRLALGLVMWGLAARLRRAWQIAAWLATVVLCHTFAAVIALGFAGTELLCMAARRQWRPAVRAGLGLALGLALTAFFWGPILDPLLRLLPAPKHLGDGRWALLAGLPVDVFTLVAQQRTRVLGGLPGVAPAACAAAGVVLALARRVPLEPAERGLAAVWGLLVVALAGVALFVAPALELGVLGPNPWRYLVVWRVAVALVAAMGLVGTSRWLGFAVASLAAPLALAVGLAETPTRLDPPTAETFAQLEAAWAQVAAMDLDDGAVYQQDSFHTPGAPPSLQWSHPGGLAGVATGRPVLGSWYGITPIATHPHTTSVGPYLVAVGAAEYLDDPRVVHARLRLFDVRVVVTVDDLARSVLAQQPDFERLGDHGPFSVWWVSGPDLDDIGAPPSRAQLSDHAAGRTWARATVTLGEGVGSTPVRVRRTWHPWIEATLDGEPVALTPEPSSGLGQATIDASGVFEVRYRDRGRPWRWPSLVAVLLWVGLGARRE